MSVRNFRKFTVGNLYIYTGTEILPHWNEYVKPVLNHEAYECISIGFNIKFRDIKLFWYWGKEGDPDNHLFGFDNWIEVLLEDAEKGEYYYRKESNEIHIASSLTYCSGCPNYKLTRPPLDIKQKEKPENSFKYKVGDRVTIEKKISKWANNTWADNMDKFIGKQYTISFIAKTEFQIEEDKDNFYFPFECIQKESVKQKTENVKHKFQLTKKQKPIKIFAKKSKKGLTINKKFIQLSYKTTQNKFKI